MGKDPAFLFYSNDFLSGTFTMSDDQVGKYIRLLCIQHQKERHVLSEKDMINICKSYDEDIYLKFIKDDAGNYYNERLNNEITRREKYSDSRSKNRTGTKSNTYNDEKFKNICLTCVKHMETETETVNITCNSCFKKSNYSKINKGAAKKTFSPPTVEEVKKYFQENGFTPESGVRAFNYYDVAGWKDSRGEQVRSWKQKVQSVWFKDENRTAVKKPYRTPQPVF